MDTKASRVVPTLYFLMDCMLDNLQVAAELGNSDRDTDYLRYRLAWNHFNALGKALYTVAEELDKLYGTDYVYDGDIFMRWHRMYGNWQGLVARMPDDYLCETISILKQMRTDGEIALTIAYLLYGEKAYQ